MASYLLWLSFTVLMAAEAAEVTCADRGEDQHSLLQLTPSNGLSGKLYDNAEVGNAYLSRGSSDNPALAQISAMSEGEAALMRLRALDTTAQSIQAASNSANVALGYESQAADLLGLAYKEIQQTEDIQEARVYQEANVTQILHEAVQQVQSASSSPLDASLLESLRQAEMAQATMIKDASQEDRALAELRSTMASAAQAASNAKLVAESQTNAALGTALASMKETAKIAQELPKQLNDLAEKNQKLSAERKSAYLIETQKAQQQGVQEAAKERAAAKADLEKAEVARKEASAMYQAASSTQDALLMQASQTAKSLMKVSAEAEHAAKYLQGALAASNGAAFVH